MYNDIYEVHRKILYEKVDIILIVFETIKPLYFDRVQTKWYTELKDYCPNKPTILIGTKIDLRDNFNLVDVYNEQFTKLKPNSYENGKIMMEKIGAVKYLECSAITKKGLKEIFDETLKTVLKMRMHNQKENN